MLKAFRLDHAIVVGISLYLLLLGWNSLTRLRNFTPDGMNYVNVARCIVAGKGIVQPTLGFNQARFAVTDSIPAPFVGQPPLYPLLIASVSRFGMDAADASLLLSVLCCGSLLLTAYILAADTSGKEAGYAALGLLLWYAPLGMIATKACSEPLGILLVLCAFRLLTRIRADESSQRAFTLSLFAGIVTGLAFATRYLFAPLAVVGILFLCAGTWEIKRKIQMISLYALGVVVPAGVVFGRNIRAVGHALPSVNSSLIGWKGNLLAVVRVLCGGYAGTESPHIQEALLALLLLFLLVAWIQRRKNAQEQEKLFCSSGCILLPLWTFGYLAFLIWQRTRVHFDSISPRLVAPAGVTVVMLIAFLVVKTLRVRLQLVQWLVLASLCLRIGQQVWILTHVPRFRAEQVFAASERLRWIRQTATPRDLIVGEDTMDVPFYFPDRMSLSFSPYTYTDVADYAHILAYCKAHRANYNHIYLVLRPHKLTKGEWRQVYGPFVTDLVFGRLQGYPGITFARKLEDGWVFEILM